MYPSAVILYIINLSVLLHFLVFCTCLYDCSYLICFVRVSVLCTLVSLGIPEPGKEGKLEKFGLYRVFAAGLL